MPSNCPLIPKLKLGPSRHAERVRTVWLAMAEQAVRDNHIADATSYVREILIRFPNDPQATALLANMTAKAETKTPTKQAPAANKFDMARIGARPTLRLRPIGGWMRWNGSICRRVICRPKSCSNIRLRPRRFGCNGSPPRGRILMRSSCRGATEFVADFAALSVADRSRVQLIRAHMAQSSFSLARAESDKLQGIANLPAEAKQLRDALQLVIDLRTEKREPAAMYDELLKLTNLDARPIRQRRGA